MPVGIKFSEAMRGKLVGGSKELRDMTAEGLAAGALVLLEGTITIPDLDGFISGLRIRG